MKHTALKTSLQIATRRARKLGLEALGRQMKADWAARLDPAAYTCRRDGQSWIADGPAGQSFRFSRMASGEVECHSATSGMSYIIRRDADGYRCSCPAAASSADGSCKHSTALRGVLMAHRMDRQTTRTALQAEGAELGRLRAEGECAERACRAEWGAAQVR